MPAPPRWRLLDPNLTWRHWNGEDEWVVYSPRSASVHLLNESGFRLLQLAGASPKSTEDFVRLLATECGLVPDEPFATAVRETITTLDMAGLIEPDPS